ncbi:hypothetical protein D3C73_1265010 [compost metagenome]
MAVARRTSGTGDGMSVCSKSGDSQNATSVAVRWMRTSARRLFFTSSTSSPPIWSMCMWVMMMSVTDARSIPAFSRRLGNWPALGKPGNCPPSPASTRMVCSPVRITSTFNAQSNASGPT